MIRTLFDVDKYITSSLSVADDSDPVQVAFGVTLWQIADVVSAVKILTFQFDQV